MGAYTYCLWDDKNRPMGTHGGPCRLARWSSLPEGWGIERFLDGVSQGVVTLDDVKRHCEDETRAFERMHHEIWKR